ncbi:MAG: toll/interleukin-1 receptor domain-containing protein [Agriterribacter sp.]
MKLLSELIVTRKEGEAVIQLLQGDLSALPAEHAVDLLVVSAFPDNYITLPGSLFLALHQKGLSVEALAQHKEIDLTSSLGCWLSHALHQREQDRFHFKRVMCFEPRRHSNQPQELVGNIFRCINTFAFNEDIDEVAMPLLATGYQKVPLENMLPALLENAVFWLQNGLPLRSIKLVVYRQENADTAHAVFSNWVKHNDAPFKPPPIPLPAAEVTAPTRPVAAEEVVVKPQPRPAVAQEQATYDYFISYAHEQTTEVHDFVQAILATNKELKVFYDRSSIPAGGLWLKKISDAIQHSSRVICILTPDYSNSDVCWDEFQCAKVMELRKKKSMIKTINFMNDDNMPPMMAIYSYIDCTEKDIQKLKAAIAQLD